MSSPANSRSASGDRLFDRALVALGLLTVAIAALFLWGNTTLAAPALSQLGVLRFLTSSGWNPVEDDFGALPFIYGTLVTVGIAIVLATPIAIGAAIFLVEIAPKRVARWLSFALELLAGIPSVVYGLWGITTLVPLLRAHVPGSLGVGLFTAGLVLSIMIFPTIATLSIAELTSTPRELREGALALGATRWESIRLAVLPQARRGLLGAIILGMSRALGETMAVAMVIGNQPEIHSSWLAPGYSLPSVIANEFAEATSSLHTGALAALALVLMLVTLALVTLARGIDRFDRRAR